MIAIAVFPWNDRLLQENGYLVLRYLAEDLPRNWTQCSTGFCARSVPGRDRLW